MSKEYSLYENVIVTGAETTHVSVYFVVFQQVFVYLVHIGGTIAHWYSTGGPFWFSRKQECFGHFGGNEKKLSFAPLQVKVSRC